MNKLRIVKLQCIGFTTWVAKLSDGREIAIAAETQEQAIGAFQNWRDSQN